MYNFSISEHLGLYRSLQQKYKRKWNLINIQSCTYMYFYYYFINLLKARLSGEFTWTSGDYYQLIMHRLYHTYTSVLIFWIRIGQKTGLLGGLFGSNFSQKIGVIFILKTYFCNSYKQNYGKLWTLNHSQSYKGGYKPKCYAHFRKFANWHHMTFGRSYSFLEIFW